MPRGPDQTHHRLATFVGPVAIAAAAGVVLAHTWRTWPDVIVDFGRELYLPWRLIEGDTLYVDVSHFSGPLSPYLNALWFRLFGTGLLTVALANLVVAAGLVAMLHGLLVRLSSRLAAATACLVFVLVFACAQYIRIGNYNWVCPYSHELTHGATLVVLALYCLDRHHHTGRTAWMAGLGFAMGLTLLTKAEVIFAGVAAVAMGLGLTLVVERAGLRRTIRRLAIVVGAALVPIVAAGAYFATVMSLDEVLRWPLGHWRTALRPDLRAPRFYQYGMGLDDVAGNVRALLLVALGYAAVLGAAVAGAFALRGMHRLLPVAAVGAFLATAALLGRLVGLDGWVNQALRPLPLFMALIAAGFVVESLRRRAERRRALRAARAAALATFALVLLAKMLLNARLFHYGFVLAMPATLVLVVAMVEWLPAAVGRLGGRAAIVRAVAFGALVAAVVPQVAFMARLVDTKVHKVEQGADAFWADDRAVTMTALLDQVRARTGRDQTLVVLPEGVMVNYLTRRVNPAPYYVFEETSFALWGQERMVGALDAAAPDWIAYVDRGGGGPRTRFGRDYGQAVQRWAAANYRPVWRRGMPFSGGSGVSVRLLRRVD